jgi:hypothetical protein
MPQRERRKLSSTWGMVSGTNRPPSELRPLAMASAAEIFKDASLVLT